MNPVPSFWCGLVGPSGTGTNPNRYRERKPYQGRKGNQTGKEPARNRYREYTDRNRNLYIYKEKGPGPEPGTKQDQDQTRTETGKGTRTRTETGPGTDRNRTRTETGKDRWSGQGNGNGPSSASFPFLAFPVFVRVTHTRTHEGTFNLSDFLTWSETGKCVVYRGIGNNSLHIVSHWYGFFPFIVWIY